MIKSEAIQNLLARFESIACEYEGVECWSARELYPILGYAKWQTFENVLGKAKEACQNAGVETSNHFTGISKTILMPKGASKDIEDFMLTRYACYLVAQNGDPRKSEIAFAPNYFAVQTRVAEVIEQRLLDYDRVQARHKLAETEKRLSGVLYERGVDDKGFGIIRSKGDQALFRMNTAMLKRKLGAPEKRDNRNTFAIKTFLKDYLDLRKDKDNELETVDSIRKGVEFKGANLWILIFAIFMASLGLNVNSTAVIIGAMLISPLMGPIMGVGLSVGLNDFELMKRSLKSFLITTLFSVTTATIFFLVSPVAEGQSELLARTSPTIYDVFIALMGGLAGVTALSTKEKGNVIPGVAIATALMPPLCTAGYGLATGNLIYFLGAFYLYFINSVFISLATFLGVRVMHFQRKEFVDKNREKKVRKYIVLIAILTMCPAVYLTVGIVQDTFFESAANRFVNDQLSFENTQVLDKKIHHEGKGHEIRVVLIGQEVVSISHAIELAVDSVRVDTVTLAVLKFGKHPGAHEKEKIAEWLKARTGAKQLRLITE